MSGIDDFGRDDGIKCDRCGGPTYLTYDQGYGLRHYRCDACDWEFGVQFERNNSDEGEAEDFYEPPFDPEDLK